MDNLMDWFLGVTGSFSVGGFLYGILSLIANRRTFNKRIQLIDRWNTSGDWRLAQKEFNEVDYEAHDRAIRWFQNPKKLYGPLIQGVWDDDQPKVYDSFWWRCYNEIYLKLGPDSQARIKYVMAKSEVGMPTAMHLCHMNISAWLAQSPPPADKFTMTDGAEEYEQIMAMQDMIDG
jgi:hypothetical protein